jgi:hypothetical protein
MEKKERRSSYIDHVIMGKVSMFPWKHASRALCRIDIFPGVLNVQTGL